MKILSRFFLGMAFIMGTTLMAQTEDVSADASKGFVAKVKASQGVIIRVPVNESGMENVGAAEMRMHVRGDKVSNPADLVKAWQQSENVNSQPVVNKGEKVDSSTCGWYGYRHYRNYWVAPSTYYYYTPTYYYYGSAYRYNYAYSYNYSYGYAYPYYGYRYYYYW